MSTEAYALSVARHLGRMIKTAAPSLQLKLSPRELAAAAAKQIIPESESSLVRFPATGQYDYATFGSPIRFFGRTTAEDFPDRSKDGYLPTQGDINEEKRKIDLENKWYKDRMDQEETMKQNAQAVEKMRQNRVTQATHTGAGALAGASAGALLTLLERKRNRHWLRNILAGTSVGAAAGGAIGLTKTSALDNPT